jgi:hypothetical protein
MSSYANEVYRIFTFVHTPRVLPMSSQFRPLLAGLAATTTCVLLWSMNWLLVLYAFVLASLGFVFWSLRKQTGSNEQKGEKDNITDRRRRRNRERSSARRRKALRNGNVYQYQFRNYTEDSDFSEVAD